MSDKQRNTDGCKAENVRGFSTDFLTISEGIMRKMGATAPLNPPSGGETSPYPLQRGIENALKGQNNSAQGNAWCVKTAHLQTCANVKE